MITILQIKDDINLDMCCDYNMFISANLSNNITAILPNLLISENSYYDSISFIFFNNSQNEYTFSIIPYNDQTIIGGNIILLNGQHCKVISYNGNRYQI